MEIKKINNTSLLLTSRHASLVTHGDKVSEKELSANKVNVILSNEFEGAFSITTPGEYETHEVWIMAFPSDFKKEENLDIFLLNIEEVRVVLLYGSVAGLNKKEIEKIGIADILVVDFSENAKEKLDVISEIDPQILIPLGVEGEEMEKIIKELGVKTVTEEKKLKKGMEDFENEDYQMEIVKIID